ncbi:hypothetical protein GF068_36980 [Polyangium spumosum]|uniref:Type VI secretion system tip protein VgrG n=1 Tax=Polyangium spumosum TaxID=889282 RepID=A0A6N7PZQ5_9BACT|nr:hypothetical protein [Polyangium spumosum]
MTETVRAASVTANYLLGTREGWGALRVVRWHCVEEISRPFHYDITLLCPRAEGDLDLDTLVDTGATFCIRTSAGIRAVHGILAEAEELEQTRSLRVFRVVLAPHLLRARFRQSCQVFRHRSIVDIVSAVLRNDTPARPRGAGGLVPFDGKAVPFGVDLDRGEFWELVGAFRWALVGDDAARLSDPDHREHVTQYNETDFDFVSRLLEEEGISYFFEHDARGSILTLTDYPGRVALLQTEERHTLHTLHDLGRDPSEREIVRAFRPAGRIGLAAVRVRDYAPEEPLTRVEAVAGDRSAAMYTEYPAAEGRVRGQTCRVPATLRLERSEAERHLAEGSGTVRSLQAGLRVHLHDQDGLREDVDLLVVRVETHAIELLPEGVVLGREDDRPGLESRFVALPMAYRFRPARVMKNAGAVRREQAPDGEHVQDAQFARGRRVQRAALRRRGGRGARGSHGRAGPLGEGGARLHGVRRAARERDGAGGRAKDRGGPAGRVHRGGRGALVDGTYRDFGRGGRASFEQDDEALRGRGHDALDGRGSHGPDTRQPFPPVWQHVLALAGRRAGRRAAFPRLRGRHSPGLRRVVHRHLEGRHPDHELRQRRRERGAREAQLRLRCG